MVDPSSHKAFLEGETLNLTSTEFKMLFLLVKNSGMVLSRQTMEDNLWSERGDSHGLVKKYIQRLRLKLRDDARQPSWIMNVHGVGYRFVGPSPGALESPQLAITLNR